MVERVASAAWLFVLESIVTDKHEIHVERGGGPFYGQLDEFSWRLQ